MLFPGYAVLAVAAISLLAGYFLGVYVATPGYDEYLDDAEAWHVHEGELCKTHDELPDEVLDYLRRRN